MAFSLVRRFGVPRIAAFAHSPSRHGVSLLSTSARVASSQGREFKAPLIDYKGIRDNVEEHALNAKHRNVQADPAAAAEAYNHYLDKLKVQEALRRERKQLSKQGLAPEELRARGRELKVALAEAEQATEAYRSVMEAEALKLPVLTHPDSPIGDESQARTLRLINDKPEFDFEPKDHLVLGEEHDMFDFSGGAELAGGKFVILRNDAALMEMALAQWALQRACAAGFTPILAPDVAHHAIVSGCGFRPRDESSGSSQIYSVENTDLCLVGTAEIAIAGMKADQIIPTSELPMRTAAFGHCFRKEAGSRGKASRGLYRLHQFSKVELFVHAAEDQSASLFDSLVNFQESLFSDLGLHCRVLEMPTEELGMSAHRKIDIEAWMPGRQAYGEISSASHCLDYQSRRLHTRYKVVEEDGSQRNKFVHTLNATALAVPRVLLTILETFQQPDGSVVIPSVLQPYMGNRDVLRPGGCSA